MNLIKKKLHASTRLNLLLGLFGYYADHIDYVRKYYPTRLIPQDLSTRRSSDTILKNWQHLYKYFSKDEARSLACKFGSSVMIRRAHIYDQNK